MRIERAHGCPGGYLVWGGDYGRSREGTLIQTDWDYPAVAQRFGWSLVRVQVKGTIDRHLADPPVRVYARRPRSPKCEHRGTDGTIRCPDCHIPAGVFIAAAGEYLDERAGHW